MENDRESFVFRSLPVAIYRFVFISEFDYIFCTPFTCSTFILKRHNENETQKNNANNNNNMNKIPMKQKKKKSDPCGKAYKKPFPWYDIKYMSMMSGLLLIFDRCYKYYEC